MAEITREGANKALALAIHIAPTLKEQSAFSHLFNQLVAAGEPWKKVVEVLVGTMYDGLRYGNWPMGG